MTGPDGRPDGRSGRCSGRVESALAFPLVERGDQPARTPERLSTPGSHSSSAAVPSERRAQRIGAKQLGRLSRSLSDREWAVLASVDEHRFLTTTHLQVLHFADHSTPSAAARICRRVLARLSQFRVLEHLERRVGGVRAGSASFVWRVGPVGGRLLNQASGEGIHARRKEPSARFLDHCLVVADCHLALVLAARAGQLELIQAGLEPACWRRYLGVSGSPETLKPDLYVVTAGGQYEDHWFAEVDRATESLPVVVRKCLQYERYRRTGQEQGHAGVFPWVLWIVPDELRARKVRQAIASSRQLDRDLYRVATTDEFIQVITGEGGAL